MKSTSISKILGEIHEVLEYNDYPLRNQEDLIESRTSWEDLKDITLSFYYTLRNIEEELTS